MMQPFSADNVLIMRLLLRIQDDWSKDDAESMEKAGALLAEVQRMAGAERFSKLIDVLREGIGQLLIAHQNIETLRRVLERVDNADQQDLSGQPDPPTSGDHLV